MSRWVKPLGTAAADGFDVVIDERIDGWEHTGLRIVTFDGLSATELDVAGTEFVVVPLNGGCLVEAYDSDGVLHTADLAGRADVWAGATDVAYVPAGWRISLSGPAGGRTAICTAPVGAAAAPQKFAHLPAAGVPVEMRGAGTCSREVRNFGVPDVLDAAAIIVCEVLTPAGNWSSYPPHKHDEDRPGQEAELEEIYYFETRVEGGRAVSGADPVGYQRVYGTGDRPIDVSAEVRTGDVVLVPHGWHGPSMAAPGYDLYYLNVMAGPGATRAWLICDDPSHGWVRSTWTGQEIDPRLPFGDEPT
ncbi:5-deoxy-glucuronate isomerase [Actinoplanes derwentensis]|uniref:5-deoxyglucuronate isomerase n=1 Tax=Actinoplanes derwentensis TaxID=113562 RepID=A0A1H1V875_9ACTN|nr:5-deoxy-glucuronate isomerase [Actinoplanes derwentensis]GID89260.1 5-deoxy-glucuronate isomerase [Actinoplanes derwentensis]SDS80954.1 5-deoxyglucuronate isomerase [Actinoplanes derwentensis]